MTIAMTPPSLGVPCSLKSLQVGEEEVPVEGRSLSQCLEDMQRRGWSLISSHAGMTELGARCIYTFERPVPEVVR
jgi:hypothetical protein